MNKLLYAPLLLAGLSIAPVSLAAEQTNAEAGIYIGAGIGYYRINDDDFLDENDRMKDNRTAWRVYGGFDAGRIFAVEGAYTDFGSSSDGLAKTELSGVSAAVLIGIPLFEYIAPYGKVGMLYWDRERSFGSLSSSDDGTDLFYGLGLRFGLTPNAGMRLEYERYAIDNTDLDMASVNLQFRF